MTDCWTRLSPGGNIISATVLVTVHVYGCLFSSFAPLTAKYKQSYCLVRFSVTADFQQIQQQIQQMKCQSNN